MTQLLTAREVAAKVGRSRSQVNRDAAHGLIQTEAKAPGPRGARLFSPEAVDQYIEAIS